MIHKQHRLKAFGLTDGLKFSSQEKEPVLLSVAAFFPIGWSTAVDLIDALASCAIRDRCKDSIGDFFENSTEMSTKIAGMTGFR
ncbi:MAG: hypothetical protein KGL74_00475 [Elusimicrobia bacterium]|nr:hypothetical protein [Elusimicrobiota bacterium]